MPAHPACLSYWHPRLQSSGMPTPTTLMLRTDVALVHLLDGATPGISALKWSLTPVRF